MSYQLTILICIASIMSGCGVDANSERASTGTFEATLGQQVIETAVTCEALSSEEIWFYSDQDDYSSAIDTNGDGIAVTGQPSLGEGLTLALEIIIDGKTFTTNSGNEAKVPGYRPLRLQLHGRTLTGNGTMLGETFPLPELEFRLDCQE